MLAIAFEVTLTTVANTVLAAFIFAVIGSFTQKKLNPRYGDLIEQRMNRVAWLAFVGIGTVLSGAVALDLHVWYRCEPSPPDVSLRLIRDKKSGTFGKKRRTGPWCDNRGDCGAAP